MDTTAVVMFPDIKFLLVNRILLVFSYQILMNVMKVIGVNKTATTVSVHMHAVATVAIVSLEMKSLV